MRDSEVALVPRTATVRCVEERARALQGWRDEVWIERLRVQRYRPGGHYAHHFDWSTGRGGWGRVSSFMVWVDDGSLSRGRGRHHHDEGDSGKEKEEVMVVVEEEEEVKLEGGGTEFPLLRAGQDPRWCRFVECPGSGPESGASERQKGKGVVFKPLPGNAVFWENFMADGTGRGYDETWHAGLPVKKGVKVGLNIWSWGRIE